MGLFSAPPTPKVEEPPPPVQVDKTQLEADERLKLARRRGREATLVAGNSPLTGQTRQATLVGQSITGQ